VTVGDAVVVAVAAEVAGGGATGIVPAIDVGVGV
jgi:hypothetical protein